MKNNHAKAESVIASGLDELRRVDLGCDAKVAETVHRMTAQEARSLGRATVWRWAFACLALAGVGGVGLLWPKPSNAATMLHAVIQASESAFQKQTAYSVDASGQRRLNWYAYVASPTQYVFYMERAAPQMRKGDTIFNYQTTAPEGGYVTMRRCDEKMESTVKPMSLRNLVQGADPGSLKVFRDELHQGIRTNRFVFNHTLVDGQGKTVRNTVTVVANAANDYPMYQEVRWNGSTDAWLETFEYPKYDPKLVQLRTTPKTRWYDLDKQIENIRERVLRPMATCMVGDIEVALRAVIVGEYGDLAVITSGGTGAPRPSFGQLRDERANRVVSIKGLKIPRHMMLEVTKREVYRSADGSSFSTNDGPIHEVGVPWDYRGVSLVVQCASFSGGQRIPDRLTLSVPVWKPGANRGERIRVGNAVFRDVRPYRVSGLIEALAPMNICIFDPRYGSDPVEGQPAQSVGR